MQASLDAGDHQVQPGPPGPDLTLPPTSVIHVRSQVVPELGFTLDRTWITGSGAALGCVR